MKNIVYQIIGTFIGVLIGTGLLFTFKAYLALPTVYTSNTTGKCVMIELGNGKKVGCERLKEFDRYENIWVK